MTIFRRPHGYLHLRRPKERGQSHRSIRLRQWWEDFGESRLQYRIGLGRIGSSHLHQRLAVSTWWCAPQPSIREVGRNGETTTPRGPTIHPVAPQLSLLTFVSVIYTGKSGRSVLAPVINCRIFLTSFSTFTQLILFIVMFCFFDLWLRP